MTLLQTLPMFNFGDFLSRALFINSKTNNDVTLPRWLSHANCVGEITQLKPQMGLLLH